MRFPTKCLPGILFIILIKYQVNILCPFKGDGYVVVTKLHYLLLLIICRILSFVLAFRNSSHGCVISKFGVMSSC